MYTRGPLVFLYDIQGTLEATYDYNGTPRIRR